MRSTGAMAASFTSSAMTPVTRNLAALPSEVDVVRPAPRKAYVSMHTSLGDLNIELHADLVPQTCKNFLMLAARGYYNGVTFHRAIKHFMLQGGDPTGTGKGGLSAWGKPFKDEFHSSLKHDKRGVVSMANSGPASNGSQFFILFKSAAHLDGKHSVFGQLVGGLETTLSAMERVPTDGQDKPQTPIVINAITVFDDPFEENAAAQPQPAPATAEALEVEGMHGKWFSDAAAAYAQPANGDKTVGRLLPASTSTKAPPAKEPAVKKMKPSGYGNFANW
jgi:peptidyl-prolyl cis-trans isomerase-like protein 2